MQVTSAATTLSGANAGTTTNLSGSFSGIGNVQDLGTGTLRNTNATWTMSGANAGTTTNLSGSFSGIGNLLDLAAGTLRAGNNTWVLTGSNAGTVALLEFSRIAPVELFRKHAQIGEYFALMRIRKTVDVGFHHLPCSDPAAAFFRDRAAAGTSGQRKHTDQCERLLQHHTAPVPAVPR